MREFYLGTMRWVDLKGQVKTSDPKLFFKFDEKGNTFDGVATREHVLNYKEAYDAFTRANPDYVLPWGDVADLSLVLGDVVHVPVAPVVAAAPVEVKAESAPIVEEVAEEAPVEAPKKSKKVVMT